MIVQSYLVDLSNGSRIILGVSYISKISENLSLTKARVEWDKIKALQTHAMNYRAPGWMCIKSKQSYA